jgi:hypothetical protein
MPSLDFIQNLFGFHFYYCDDCKSIIKRALSDTLYLKNCIRGGCNNFYGSNHSAERKKTCFLPSDAWYSIDKKMWKFSNDARRQLLREIEVKKP